MGKVPGDSNAKRNKNGHNLFGMFVQTYKRTYTCTLCTRRLAYSLSSSSSCAGQGPDISSPSARRLRVIAEQHDQACKDRCMLIQSYYSRSFFDPSTLFTSLHAQHVMNGNKPVSAPTLYCRARARRRLRLVFESSSEPGPMLSMGITDTELSSEQPYAV